MTSRAAAWAYAILVAGGCIASLLVDGGPALGAILLLVGIVAVMGGSYLAWTLLTVFQVLLLLMVGASVVEEGFELATLPGLAFCVGGLVLLVLARDLAPPSRARGVVRG